MHVNWLNLDVDCALYRSRSFAGVTWNHFQVSQPLLCDLGMALCSLNREETLSCTREECGCE